ncbi:MAG TPA: SDR family oxidoreductase [Tepidisphaeraceae bacterium]|nr:SDR family oxidoreductase [Tepidisphaeraceae bacterium]
MSIKLKELNEQVIVITGASSGIGLCTAESACKQGAKVVLSARSENTLTDVVSRLNDAGCEAISVPADVANRSQLEGVADAAVRRFGRIDTWVNNAGVAIYGRLDEVTEEDNRRLFDTNFWGVVNGSLVALQHLKSNGGGALINLGSEVSEAAAPLLGMYTASKHAVKGFTDVLRVEIEHVDKAPISITLIQPTAVDTPFDEHGWNYMDKQPDLPTPMIDPQKVADAILEAAVKPTRDIRVGTMSKLNTFVAKNLPAVGDRMSAKQIKNFKRDEPPRDPDGTLFVPGEGGHIHGDHPQA